MVRTRARRAWCRWRTGPGPGCRPRCAVIGPHLTILTSDWSQFGKELYPGDLERLGPHLEVAMEAFPCFAEAEIQSVVNGPITYTPDILPMVGPSMLPNMWLAVGFGYGVVHGEEIEVLNIE